MTKLTITYNDPPPPWKTGDLIQVSDEQKSRILLILSVSIATEDPNICNIVSLNESAQINRWRVRISDMHFWNILSSQ